MDGFADVEKNQDIEFMQTWATHCWAIWTARNLKVFENINPCAQTTLRRAANLQADFTTGNEANSTTAHVLLPH